MVSLVKRITTAEAVVRTATVEVRSLTLSGKQMTLSVFRQLQQDTLIDPETLKFNGIPWGKVNYFWGDCTPNHLHIVWQKGNELRRDCVYPEWPELRRTQRLEEEAKTKLDNGARAIILLNAYRSSVAPERATFNVIFPVNGTSWPVAYDDSSLTSAHEKWDFIATGNMTLADRLCIGMKWNSAKDALIRLPDEERRPLIEARLQNSIGVALRSYYLALGFPTEKYWSPEGKVSDFLTVEAINQTCKKYEVQLARTTERLSWAPSQWEENYAQLDGLDQLFIAV